MSFIELMRLLTKHKDQIEEVYEINKERKLTTKNQEILSEYEKYAQELSKENLPDDTPQEIKDEDEEMRSNEILNIEMFMTYLENNNYVITRKEK